VRKKNILRRNGRNVKFPIKGVPRWFKTKGFPYLTAKRKEKAIPHADVKRRMSKEIGERTDHTFMKGSGTTTQKRWVLGVQ